MPSFFSLPSYIPTTKLPLLKTAESFTTEYVHRLQEPKYSNLSKVSVAGVAYDAVWALARGLDRAVTRIDLNDSSGCDHLPGELVPLEEFDYQNERMGCVLRKSFSQVSFHGITVSHPSCIHSVT